MTNDALSALIEAGKQNDDDLDLAVLGVSFFMCEHQGISQGRYLSHLQKLSREVAARHAAILAEGGADDAATILAAFKFVFNDTHDYRQDDAGAEILESADILRVIHRACGHQIALAYLSITILKQFSAFSSVPCVVEGVNVPGRFVCRLLYKGEALIFDPSAQCCILQAHDLRESVKNLRGAHAELSLADLDGLDGRAVLLRLCHLIKARQIEMGDYERALGCVERMMLFAPDAYPLLLDAGVLCVELSEPEKAVSYLESYISRAPHDAERRDARLILDQLAEDVKS